MECGLPKKDDFSTKVMNSALTLFHLKTCSSTTKLFQVSGVHDNSGS